MSSSPSFSAYYAHKRAWNNAVRLSASRPAVVTCAYCAGSKTIKMNCMNDNTITEVPCYFCKNSGTNDPVKQLYSKLVWCSCKNRETSGFLHAADGRRVFGNDTYLCSSCGFVKQFG